MSEQEEDTIFAGFKLSYLVPQSPANFQNIFLAPAIKRMTFSEDATPPPQKDNLNIYLRIKYNDHALKEGPCQVLDGQTLSAKIGRSNSRKNATETKFKFSKIFGPETSQETLFQDVCLPSLRSFIRGENCLLFAYGATNSGKTFTIQGTPEKPGIIPRTIDVLFSSLEGKVSRSFKYKPDKVIDVVWLDTKSQQDELKFKKSILSSNLDRSQSSRLHSSKSTVTLMSDDSLEVGSCTSTSSVVLNEYTSAAFRAMKKSLHDVAVDIQEDSNVVYSVWLSYAEIYNENVYDLLETTPKGQKRKPLFLGETDQKDAFVKGLHHVCVFSGDEAFQVFQFGQHNLKTAPTNVNHTSSRSHSIFTIKLLRHLNTENASFATVSTFSLVDLAGAERAKKTHNVGERMKESQSINTSLHVLGKCLEVIRQNQTDFVKRIIPFRESKLTKLFQRALRGREYLTLIVNVNFDSSLHEETVNVLKFSALAKEIVFDTSVKSKTCTLRSSRFSRYISEASFKEKSDKSLEYPSRIEALLTLVDSLQKEVNDLKKKNAEVELKTRDEMYNKFTEMLQQVQKKHQNSMKESEDRLEEYHEWRFNMIQEYYERKLKEIDTGKLKRSRTDSGSDSETEDGETLEDLLQQNKVLGCKLNAIQEQRDSFKKRQEELQLTNSKLVFENASLKNELECAKRIVKARISDDKDNDPLVTELQSQLEDLRKALKDKEDKLKESEDLIVEAKNDYCVHMQEHEDEFQKRDVLEKLLASKEEEIEDLKSQLVHCQLKIQEQAASLQQHEENDENEKYRTVCEARDEYMFSASKYEQLYRKLEKENQELRENTLNKSADRCEVNALEAQVASLEDELKKNKEAFQRAGTKILELEKELEATRKSSEEKESIEKELSVLQKEIKDLIKSKKLVMEELAVMSKENEKLQEQIKLAEAGLAQEQNNAKDLQKYVCAENEKLALHVTTLKRDLEQKEKDCQKLEENNHILEEMVNNQEAEMESFKNNRDTQFKLYDDMLKQKQEEIEMHKREVQRYQELFVKNPTPNKKDYEERLAKQKEEIMWLKEELQKYKLEASRVHRRVKVTDENDPSISNDLSLAAGGLPVCSDSESIAEKPRTRRKKLFNPPDEVTASPVLYVRRTTRARRM